MQASFKELSPAKLNLFLKIVGKREVGFHNIRSGVTLINLFDEVIAKKNSRFTLKYIGRFAPENNKFEDCIIEKIFSKLNIKKPNYAFTIKKNTPIMSGLGSASSNAATVIKILEKQSNEINNLLKFMRSLPDAIFSRLTGSGSCIFSAFESKNTALNSQIIFNKSFPSLWSTIVENNFINDT